MKEELKIAIEAALEAGRVIMEVQGNEDFLIEEKEDSSPLTLADQMANEVINSYLIHTDIPIMSEENAQLTFDAKRNWKQCWIVDPLDGTKEFIKRNGEFTVNFALVSEGKPVLGVIFAPALNVLYFGEVTAGKAYKIINPGNIVDISKVAVEITPSGWEGEIKIVGSRSHMNEDTLGFIRDLKKRHDRKIEAEVVSKGSSLKFCLVAEGAAHVYPRFAPTMEWDTAAGQAICEAVGLKCIAQDTGLPLHYNREDLLNPHFLVSSER